MTTNWRFERKHREEILHRLIGDNMPPEFYTHVLSQMDHKCDNVRDIIKYGENKMETKWESIPENTKISCVNTFLIDLITRSESKGLKKLSRIYAFTDRDIQEMFPNHYAYFDSFLVFGDPFSTDTDVIVFVRKQDCHMGKTKELSNESINAIREQLRALGYDIRRELDINVVYVDPITQMITASSKGSTKKTQHILMATYMYHPQVMSEVKTIDGQYMPLAIHLHPMQNLAFTDEDSSNDLRAFAKYVLDNVEEIASDYPKFRPIRADLYAQGANATMRFMKKITPIIVYDPDDVKRLGINLAKFHDIFKSITMKLLQILLHNRCNATSYVKMDLANSVHRIFSSESHEVKMQYEAGALWFLFRGCRGSFCKELFPVLLEQYNMIVDDFLTRTDIKPFIFPKNEIMIVRRDYDIVPSLTDRMLSLFFESPEVFTEEFETLWIRKYGSGGINLQFRILSSDEKKFYDDYKNLDPDVLRIFKQCFIFVDQRSPQWLDMLSTKFVCGNNGGVIDKTTFQGPYNLIRGATIELLSMHLFDPILHANLHGFEKLSLGFIVEKNEVGSKGFAPDMCLISNDAKDTPPEFILIEIKGLKHSRKNADYYRGLSLATKQIGSGREILSQFVPQNKLRICRGLVILCCVEDLQFKMEVHHVDI